MAVVRKHLPVVEADPRPRDFARDDCRGQPGACPLVSCRYHLLLNITPKGTMYALKSNSGRGAQAGDCLSLPDRDVPYWKVREFEEYALALLDAMPDTCALDVADRGEHTLEEIADLWTLSRERIRQAEQKALRKLLIYFRSKGMEVTMRDLLRAVDAMRKPSFVEQCEATQEGPP